MRENVRAAAAICAVVFGKAAGGFLGDAVGMRKAAIGSLGALASLILLALGLKRGGGAVSVFLSLAVSLLLTLALELGFALLWGVERGDYLLVPLANVLTNPVVVLCYTVFLLNYALWFSRTAPLR